MQCFKNRGKKQPAFFFQKLVQAVKLFFIKKRELTGNIFPANDLLSKIGN